MSERITVFGAGSWGTALAISLAGTHRDVILWARRSDAASFMQQERHNPTYLPDAIIPENVLITADLETAAQGRGLWVIATPSQSVRDLATQLIPFATKETTIVSVAKGIENGTLLTTTGVLHEVLSDRISESRLGVLYGPSHAEEVAVGKPTTLVSAARSTKTARHIQKVFMTPRLRVYLNRDLLGVEIGGSVKNVLAIATGISDGIGYGDNAKAALITRGITEMQRLGVAMGAEAETFAGLTGIGDLVVTCTSKHSRNRWVGEQIGKGRSLPDVEKEMRMVAEGVRTTISVSELARRYRIEMPITSAVHAILFKGKTPEVAVNDLMTRSAKTEHLHDVLEE